MFIYELPYSKQSFKINILRFKHIFDISRFIYEDNDTGLIEYFNNFFKIESLNIIDKFFVLLKARELFVNENLTLSSSTGNINIPIKNLLSKLEGIPPLKKQYRIDNLLFDLDVPKNFLCKDVTTDIFVSVIDRITFDDIEIDFNKITLQDKEAVLDSLPSSFFNSIKEYVLRSKLSVLFLDDSKFGVGSIELNFMGTDPFIFIKSLFSDNSLSSCRETLFYLSKRIGGETVMNSTMSDIQFYLDEYSAEIRQNKDGFPLASL